MKNILYTHSVYRNNLKTYKKKHISTSLSYLTMIPGIIVETSLINDSLSS